MQKIVLHIGNSAEEKSIALEDELSVGRTDSSQIVLEDVGLSRKNTTFFRDGEACLVVDENSLNGTFLNGEKISGAPVRIYDGDEIKIGSETIIRVEIADEQSAISGQRSAAKEKAAPDGRRATEKSASPQSAIRNPPSARPPFVLIAAAASVLLIVSIALIAILIARSYENGGGNGGKPTPAINTKAPIPIRVIDPLGGEDPDDLDEIFASWEVEEEELKAETVSDVKVATTNATLSEEADLNVTAAFLADRQKKSLEARSGETGIRPAGLNVPKELYGDGVIKQKAKLGEMKTNGYQQPMDFSDLAQKRLNKELIEMPMATDSFYLAVGGSASDAPFSSFSFKDGNDVIAVGTPKYAPLAQLAANFAGQKYDLNNPDDRKQMRVRLLRMFNKRAKPILEEIADAYFKKFNRPLRVTSLTRSMDYQILLNATNANSFVVRGEGSLPPHTSGCAFDLARKHMTAEEQNFVMAKLAEMENARKLDALIEYGTNACWHVFIYDDGNPPKGF
ncbi:MAG TPA: FHA domain-containing protein [Pyrinomonadaceae bacterium]|jgi:pSer/pThr/pTyr-binding forkhead associated (FHA) protein